MPRSKKGKRGGSGSSKGEFNLLFHTVCTDDYPCTTISIEYNNVSTVLLHCRVLFLRKKSVDFFSRVLLCLNETVNQPRKLRPTSSYGVATIDVFYFLSFLKA